MTNLKRSSLLLASAGVAAVVAVTGSGQAVGAPAKDSPSPAPQPGGQTSVEQVFGFKAHQQATGGGATASKADGAWRLSGDKKTKIKPWQARNIPAAPDTYVYSPSAVTNKVVWTAAGDGAVYRTKNGGKSWARYPLVDPNLGTVSYVAAANKKKAVASVYTQPVAPATTGNRVLYSTKNGGKTWKPVLAPATPYAGFNCTTFAEDGEHGFTLGGQIDANSNRLTVFTTKNGGKKWKPVNPAKAPLVLPDSTPNASEGATCTNGRPTSGKVTLIYSTSSLSGTTFTYAQRVAYGKKYGAKWTGAASALPIPPDAGYFVNDVAVQGKKAVGVGSNRNYEDNGTNAFPDPSVIGKGKRFLVGGDTAGYMYGVDLVPGKTKVAVAVGDNGTRVSTNGGRAWVPLDLLQYFNVSCAEKTCWGTGENTQVSRLRIK